ncbi:MAG TPA: MFS transporter [Anaerolineae bacterium]|nr:MFS transporter [Anaerolineae bacterium]
MLSNLPPALNYPDFRRLWLGQLFSSLGTQMQLIALNWHIYQLLTNQTISISLFNYPLTLDAQALGLGALGLVRILPIIFFVLIGGLLADTLDRRRLLITTQTAIAFVSLTLAILTWQNQITIFSLYALTAIASIFAAMDEPALQAIIPNLIPPQHLSSALSLNTLLWYLGTITGPGLAALLIAQTDISFVYFLNALSFGAVLLAIRRPFAYSQNQPVTPPPSTPKTFKSQLALIQQGLHFTYNNKLIWSTMLIDFWATFFGSARTMLPLIADRIFNAGVNGYATLATAQPIGAVLAGLVLARRQPSNHQGRNLLLSVALYGLATTLFGFTTSFWLAYLFFALTGVGDTISTVIRGTIRQLNTPDHLRGRMTSVNMLFFMGGPQLGELEAGIVAALWNPPLAIITGGLLTITMTAYFAYHYPQLRHYQSHQLP